MILTELISLWHLPWNYLPKMGKTAKLMTSTGGLGDTAFFRGFLLIWRGFTVVDEYII